MKRLLILLLFIYQPAYSQHLADGINPGDPINEIELPLTAETAAELIAVETGGKILSSTEIYLGATASGTLHFRVKVLLDKKGIIKIYLLDAQTGHKVKPTEI